MKWALVFSRYSHSERWRRVVVSIARIGAPDESDVDVGVCSGVLESPLRCC